MEGLELIHIRAIHGRFSNFGSWRVCEVPSLGMEARRTLIGDTEFGNGHSATSGKAHGAAHHPLKALHLPESVQVSTQT